MFRRKIKDFSPFFFVTFGRKTNCVEFFSLSYRDNPELPASTDCQMCAYIYIFPKGLRGSVKPLHLFLECGKLKGRRNGGFSQLPYLYLSQSPSSDFSFSRSLTSLPFLVFRFVVDARRGRVRRDSVINYRVSKPRRAFICTALALSLTPFLIRARVMSDAFLRDVALSTSRAREIISISIHQQKIYNVVSAFTTSSGKTRSHGAAKISSTVWPFKWKLRAACIICDFQINFSFVRCGLFPFQLRRTILVPDYRTQKVGYLEIGVYRTTPLMLDRGLVGDNRSSKVFEFATFSFPT